MDSSTGSQCKKLEEALGGPLDLAEITGSKAFHRFTGNQIAKIFQGTPDVYKQTEVWFLWVPLGLGSFNIICRF
jgi:xylulokinase